MKRFCIGLAAVVVLVGVGRASATVVSWGYDSVNQVTGTPGGTGFTAIAGGGSHSLALTSDGSIVSWGSDSYNLVTGTPSGTGFTDIAGGLSHSLALTSDNVVPEPSTLAIWSALGGIGLIAARRKRKRVA